MEMCEVLFKRSTRFNCDVLLFVCRDDVSHHTTVRHAGELVNELSDLKTHMKHVLSVRIPLSLSLSEYIRLLLLGFQLDVCQFCHS